MRSVDILYEGFKPYVRKKDREHYRIEFIRNNKNSLKFVKAFFPKYINLKRYHRKPKSPEDAYLFNYYFVVMEVFGLKKTDTLKEFIKLRGMPW